MKIDLQHLQSNWKSTAQSILTTTFALTGALMVSNVISPKTAAIMGTANAVCKILVGVLQQDAGTTLAVVPGKESPVSVPSHEIPNDPTVSAVK